MTTQEENVAICERLLKWKRARISGLGVHLWHAKPYGDDGEQWVETPTPSFDTWADAGLILDAWIAVGNDYDIEGTVTETRNAMSARLRQIKGTSYVGDFGGDSETAPLAIRAAALEYIKSLEKTP
jgi:hypothetical protein